MVINEQFFAMVSLLFLVGLFPAAWASVIPSLDPAAISSRSTSLTKANFSTYAPVRIQCPERSQWVRPASGLSEEEAAWVKGRKAKVLPGLKSYLGRLNFEDFDVDKYLERIECNERYIPTIGMAISGGGWSSAFTGVGGLRAFDDRFAPSCEQRTGGILQSMTYLSGLSGGSWPVMSLATYNFPMIDNMITNWHTPQPALGAENNTAHRADGETLFKEIYPKFEAGFNVSFMDLLGRGFSYEFVPGPNGGLSTMLSDVAKLSNFENHEMPFPMWQAAQSYSNDVKFFGLDVPFYNATLFEWNPLEFGAWQGVSSFFPTKYLGTKMSDGKPVDQCIVGFDRAGFMLGLAADAINYWWLEDVSNNTLGSFSKRSSDAAIAEETYPFSGLKDIQKLFTKYFNYTRDEDIYTTLPNPFASASSVDNESKPPANLTLLDESENGQSIPLWSQIQPARNLDFIVAWDADEDSHPYSWNNGTNMYNTYIAAMNNSLPFPIVPPPETFINRGYTSKPTFFGCDANLTNTGDLSTPIVLYFLNAPYSAYTNYSWLQEAFSHEQMAVVLTNSFNYVTQGNSTLDKEWPECLGCAAIDRSLARVGMERTEQCQRCMTRYCWDGVEDNSKPGILDIPLVLKPDLSFAEWNKSVTADFWPEIEK